MPPPGRPDGPGPRQLKPIEELSSEEARVELAQLRTAYPSDEDFQVLLDDAIERLRTSRTRQREAIAERITELEAKASE